MAAPASVDPRIVCTPGYDLTFLGLERLHPFDGRKASRAWRAARRRLGAALDQRTLRPTLPLTREQLLAVHTPAYLDQLRSPAYVAQVLELPIVARLPSFIIDWRLLRPMRLGAQGTRLAAEAALRGGLAYNLAGGYHHAGRDQGQGFCCYADVHLTLAALRQTGALAADDRVLILDLDAHQGNGHERLAQADPQVFIADVYNQDIFPGDWAARRRIDLDRPVRSGTGDDAYLRLLRRLLPEVTAAGPFRLAFYIAGTDVAAEDPLGGMALSGDALRTRDRLVLTALLAAGTAVTMLAGGGYGPHSYLHLADSLSYVVETWGRGRGELGPGPGQGVSMRSG
ncbi:MAG: histone deacetylase [Anaerolineales bacterium]|nr:histone deacetylase [Anaerolineales bacterium]